MDDVEISKKELVVLGGDGDVETSMKELVMLRGHDDVETSRKELVMLKGPRRIKRKSKKKGKRTKLGMPRGARGIKQKSKKTEAADDVCALCDDGGYITCCDGGCLRSFHLTREHGEASNCPTLGLTIEQAKVIIEKENFICKNCEYMQHQCFACELLGSSDLSSCAEVFQCKDANCGHFYHPMCIAELLHPDNRVWATHFEQYVAAGRKFLCPVHKCRTCNEGENKGDVNLQFAVCRRCPTTYHRKCLPSDIPLKSESGPNGYIQRAWDGLLHDRILMYCTNHVEIIEELGIPKARPIIFPDAGDLCVAEGPECVPMEQDEDDHPLPLLSQPASPFATVHDRLPGLNDDRFVPKSLCMHPYPGSCGWLDDSDSDTD